MLDFPVQNLGSEDVERLRAVYGPLTESVRQLVDATIRTEMPADAVAAARAEIDAVTAQLRQRQLDGSFGVRFGTEGDPMPWGNAVVGLRNALAPPLDVKDGADGGVFADFRLGAAYEGPPGHVHGGVAAMILDHVLGVATSSLGQPRLTGTITMRYRRLTPLGDLHVEARIVRTDGIKTFAEGHLADAEGITVEAEGVFISPRWAR